MVKGLIKLTRLEDFYGSALGTVGVSLIANPGLSLFNRGVLAVIVLFLNIFAFAINDIEDAEDDAKDPAKVNRNPISAKILPKSEALIFTWAIAGITLFMSYRYGQTTFVLALATIFLGFLYSFKQIRLKSIPFLDILSHGLFLGGLQSLVVITAAGNPISPVGFIIAASVFFGSVMGDINNEIRDYKVDRETGIRNTASVIDLTKIKSIAHYISVIPFSIIAIVILFNATRLTLIVAIPLIILFILYYLVKYASKRKRGFYDKHSHHIGTIFGLILIATI